MMIKWKNICKYLLWELKNLNWKSVYIKSVCFRQEDTPINLEMMLQMYRKLFFQTLFTSESICLWWGRAVRHLQYFSVRTKSHASQKNYHGTKWTCASYEHLTLIFVPNLRQQLKGNQTVGGCETSLGRSPNIKGLFHVWLNRCNRVMHSVVFLPALSVLPCETQMSKAKFILVLYGRIKRKERKKAADSCNYPSLSSWFFKTQQTGLRPELNSELITKMPDAL